MGKRVILQIRWGVKALHSFIAILDYIKWIRQPTLSALKQELIILLRPFLQIPKCLEKIN
jgi:hypothetical protein